MNKQIDKVPTAEEMQGIKCDMDIAGRILYQDAKERN